MHIYSFQLCMMWRRLKLVCLFHMTPTVMNSLIGRYLSKLYHQMKKKLLVLDVSYHFCECFDYWYMIWLYNMILIWLKTWKYVPLDRYVIFLSTHACIAKIKHLYHFQSKYIVQKIYYKGSRYILTWISRIFR